MCMYTDITVRSPPPSLCRYIYFPDTTDLSKLLRFSLCNTASNGPAHTSMIFMRLWLAIHLLCFECSFKPPKKFPPDELLDVLIDLLVLVVIVWSADHVEQLPWSVVKTVESSKELGNECHTKGTTMSGLASLAQPSDSDLFLKYRTNKNTYYQRS